MYYTNDPVADFLRHDAEQEAELQKLPKCKECGEPIQTDYAYGINGKYICEHCLEAYYRVPIEDLM